MVRAGREYLAADVPLGRHLADQLQISMALAGGGKFRTLSPTANTQTNAEIIKKFIDIEVAVKEYGQNQLEIEVWRG